MQKKSLLVALFCGALCLTGCIKNEESASVAQVRIAKATQLQALADFYKAQGQAEVIYAQAEATLKQAQAALIMAQAETEKVRAELLKVQVKLQEVKVDEEKIVWQKMQAELEVALAKAEAQKQFWANELNRLVAEAQASAIENAQKIMEAEADFEAYILALEGAKADSAKVYADLYFATLKEIEKLQVEELEYKATRTLLNQGAILAREVIYDEIDKTADTIARNKAIIAHLQEHQTLTPEQAEEALKEARENVTVAYNALDAAVELEKEAKSEYNTLKNKTADFAQGWSGVFTVDNFAPYATLVKKGIVTGYYELDEEGQATDNFIPLFTAPADGKQWAKETSKTVRYPDIDVYEGVYEDFVNVTTTDLTPASINFDNIATVVNDAVKAQEEYVTLANQLYEYVAVPLFVAGTQAVIDVYQDTLDLHTAYVEARAEAVADAEAAYLQAVQDAKDAKTAKEEAWNDFQNYMLENYDVSREYFIKQWAAQAAYDEAAVDSLDADINLKIAKAGIEDLEEEYAAAVEAEAKAEGAYHKAASTTIDPDVQDAWNKAQKKYNPKFDPTKDFENFGTKAEPDYWNVKSGAKVAKTQAGSAQNGLAMALDTLQVKQEAQVNAQEDYWRGYISKAKYQTYLDAVTEAEEAVEAEETKVSTAAKGYTTAKSAYDEAAKGLTDAKAAWNPEYSALWEELTDHTYKEVIHGELKVKAWVDGEGDEAGTAQADRDTAWVTLKKAEVAVSAGTNYPWDATLPKTANVWEKATYYKNVADHYRGELKTANEALITALGKDPKKVHIEDVLDPVAEELYITFVTTKAEDKSAAKKAALMALYMGYNPDEIAELGENPKNDIYNTPKDAQYSWLLSSYNADCTAEVIDFQTNKYVPVAKLLFPTETKETWYTHSLEYEIAALEAAISEEAQAKMVEAYKTTTANLLNNFKKDAKTFLAKVDAYKAHEKTYNEWIVSIEEAEGVVNGLKMTTFDVREEYFAAQNAYDALYDVVNEGMWVFDPEENFSDELYVRRGDFAWITLNEEIEYLENENERLEAKVAFLRNVLTDGKKVLTTVNEIIDQKIQVVSDNIQILAAIAVKYRAIMDGYLGIDETTGPVDGEDEE